MRRALITGITGQDGSYLAEFLLAKGYEVYGAFRRLSTPNFWRLQSLGVYEKVKLISMDITDMSSIIEALNYSQPHEVYHLAAQSFVGASFEQPLATADMTGLATTRMLEAVRLVAKDAAFYQASTSELYGNSSNTMKNEESAFEPRSPYAVAKLYAYWITRVYREGYGLFACNGILFNHESERRGETFVSRKITRAATRIKLGLQENLYMGNLEARRDWGYARDYVEAMWMMLNAPEPDDYVIATGETHSVRDFIERAFGYLDLDWQRYVEIDPHYFRPAEVDLLSGDASKARRELGWEPKVAFDQLVKLMVDHDLVLAREEAEGADINHVATAKARWGSI